MQGHGEADHACGSVSPTLCFLLLPFQAPNSAAIHQLHPQKSGFGSSREEIAPLSVSRVYVIRSKGAEFAFRHLPFLKQPCPLELCNTKQEERR
jgi:hypothetical protein